MCYKESLTKFQLFSLQDIMTRCFKRGEGLLQHNDTRIGETLHLTYLPYLRYLLYLPYLTLRSHTCRTSRTSPVTLPYAHTLSPYPCSLLHYIIYTIISPDTITLNTSSITQPSPNIYRLLLSKLSQTRKVPFFVNVGKKSN